MHSHNAVLQKAQKAHTSVGVDRTNADFNYKGQFVSVPPLNLFKK